MTQKRKKKKSNEKHVPMRTCIACRAHRPKGEMMRFVLENRKIPVIDRDGKAHGRGANLCPDVVCLDVAIEKHAFNRVWKTKIEEGLWDEVRKEFDERLKNKAFRGDEKNVTYRVSKDVAEEVVGTAVTRNPA